MKPTTAGSSSPGAGLPPAGGRELQVLLACGPGWDADRILLELSRAGLKVASRRADTRADFKRELGSLSPDLILADHRPGQFGGLEVLELLRSRGHDVPVIVVAAVHSEEGAVECLQHGAEDYMAASSLARLPSAVLNAMKRREAERRKLEAEEALRHNTEQYRLIAENIRDLVCLLDLEGRVLYASPSFHGLLGCAPAELIGRSPLERTQPEDRKVLEALFQEARTLREPRRADVRFLHRDGHTVVVESSVAFVFDGQGAPQRIIMVSRDISERKQAEQEIERLAAFPRHNPNPILAFGADGTLVYFNQAALAMAQRLHKAHPREMLPLNVVAVVKMCLASDQNNLRLENSLGGRTLSWSFYPIAAVQLVHCYAEDITERLELETRLRQSQKMESVGQLAASVAHDFNNILTIIQGHSSLLLASQALPPGLAESMRQIGQAAERAANLTRQLLMFSRKQRAQRRLMDLNEAIKESGGMLRVLAGESIRLQLACAPSLPTIYADPGMVQQVLINLAANARDAMPKGGRLQISSATVEVTHSECLRNPDAHPGCCVCLSVTDTGCGMDSSTLERLFEPFFTTKELGKGTGLGLATVYGIVKQHQGWIDVASEPGRGTTFTIFFPAASKALDQEADAEAAAVRGGHETVLVVEDEAPLRELVVEILQQYGYKTIEAGDGLEGFKTWSERRGQIDLVLTDVMMPNGVSGRDLAEKILAIDPKVKIIYTSGYPMDVLGPAYALKEGFVFLQKPYQPQLLARTVRECLDL